MSWPNLPPGGVTPDWLDDLKNDPQYQKDKAELQARVEAHRVRRKPYMEFFADKWRKLEFTEEALRKAFGDPEVAFQVSIGDWVLRADHVSECGPAAIFWHKDDPPPEDTFDMPCFFHGTPGEAITDDQRDFYDMHLEEVVDRLLNYLEDEKLPLPELPKENHDHRKVSA